MIIAEFVVMGAPKGAARPRFVRGSGRVYKADAHAKAEADAIEVFSRGWAWDQIDRPVRLEIEVVTARPKSLMRRKDPDGRMYVRGKPDVDNVAKLLMDAATRAGIWVDDTVVVDLRVRRWVASKDPRDVPRSVVRVFEAGEPEPWDAR